jgi:putative ABC transport system substrate-binding protein
VDRRSFLGTIAGSLLLAPLAAEAQQVTTLFRVGLLSGGPRGEPTTRSPFRERLHELGLMEGKNLILESRYAEGKLERLPDLAAEFVHLKMDVIVAIGTNAAAAAKNATSTIPIVFLAGDPVRAGIVTNLARPDRNITGLSMVASELYVKRLQILKEASRSSGELTSMRSVSIPRERMAPAVS